MKVGRNTSVSELAVWLARHERRIDIEAVGAEWVVKVSPSSVRKGMQLGMRSTLVTVRDESVFEAITRAIGIVEEHDAL
jgi:hypothetical protein